MLGAAGAVAARSRGGIRGSRSGSGPEDNSEMACRAMAGAGSGRGVPFTLARPRNGIYHRANATLKILA